MSQPITLHTALVREFGTEVADLALMLFRNWIAAMSSECSAKQLADYINVDGIPIRNDAGTKAQFSAQTDILKEAIRRLERK